jgi:hypothetical protein
MASDKEKAKNYLALFNQLAQSDYADDAIAAVLATPSDFDSFKDACVSAGIINDDQDGRKTARQLLKIAKKMIRDADWGWE